MEKDSLELSLSSFFDGIYVIEDNIPTFKMLIGGMWRKALCGSQFDVHTPIDGSVISKAQLASKEDVECAVASAHDNRQIRDIPGIERIEIFNCAARVLEEHTNEFKRVLQLRQEKPKKMPTVKWRPRSSGSS